jgi:hypothetical protein
MTIGSFSIGQDAPDETKGFYMTQHEELNAQYGLFHLTLLIPVDVASMATRWHTLPIHPRTEWHVCDNLAAMIATAADMWLLSDHRTPLRRLCAFGVRWPARSKPGWLSYQRRTRVHRVQGSVVRENLHATQSAFYLEPATKSANMVVKPDWLRHWQKL